MYPDNKHDQSINFLDRKTLDFSLGYNLYGYGHRGIDI